MSGWIKAFDGDTPWATVLRVIESQSQIALDDLREQLDARTDLTPAMRDATLAYAAPEIQKRTHEALERAWLRLQAASSGVH